MSSILSSFPSPPTHVPVPAPKHLSAFSVSNSSVDGDDFGLENSSAMDGNRTAEHYTCFPYAGTSASPRSNQVHSVSSLSSWLSSPGTSSSSVPFPSSATTSPTVPVPLGPPPTFPLPPLPPTISPEERVAFVSPSCSSSSGSTRSLKKASNVGSMRGVTGPQPRYTTKPKLEEAMKRIDSSRSIQSLRGVGSSASLRSGSADSSGSSVGTHIGAMSKRRPSASEYEESILNVELDFDEDIDEDQTLVKRNPHSTSVSISTRDRTRTPQHKHPNLVSLPVAKETSSTRVKSSRIGSEKIPTRHLSPTSANGVAGSTEPGQTRSRTSSKTSSRSLSRPNTGIKPSSHSNTRSRTYSQPSSPRERLEFVPSPPLSGHPAFRSRAISSAPLGRRRDLGSPFTPTCTASTSKPPFNSSTIRASRMSTSPTTSQYSPSTPPVDITEPTTPLTTFHNNGNEVHLPSTPNPTSSDRSTSPDLRTLLTYTSEVLKSGGKGRTSGRRRNGDIREHTMSLPDRKRTSSMLSTGSGGSSAYEYGKGATKSGNPRFISNKDNESPMPARSIPSWSSKQQSRLRSDSKSSTMSKPSTTHLTMLYATNEGRIDGLPVASSSRSSLIDDSFEDERDVFQEETSQTREEDAFSFFHLSRSSNHPGEDEPTLSLSFPIMEDEEAEDIIDLKTPLPHLLLRAGVLSPHSKLLPRSIDSSDDEDNERGMRKKSHGRASPEGSVTSTATMATTSSKHPRDARDTVKRRIRHKDGRLLRGGIGLTTGLGWSDSEDEDAPSEFTTRLKRLASMGGLSALSRKSSMASNMSGYGSAYAGSTSAASVGRYGSIYESGSATSTNSYAPSVSVSQSGSGGRMSVYSDVSMTSGGLYASQKTSSPASASASSSRNVSRQSSFSMSYHSLNHSTLNGSRKEFEIVEEDADGRSGEVELASNISGGIYSDKDKERARKTASMIHIDERIVRGSENAYEEPEDTQRLGVIPTQSVSLPSPSPSRQRISTISVSSTSSVSSAFSNTSTLNPPSITGSLTPTPETPTTPTPMASFDMTSSADSSFTSSALQSALQITPETSDATSRYTPSIRQPTRLNTNLNGTTVARSHSPVPPPSPAPTGPLPPTPGNSGFKMGRGVGTSAFLPPPVRTSSSGPSSEIPAATITATVMDTTPMSTPLPPVVSSQQRVVSPTPSHPARVTSPTPSFSMPTGSRTIHPTRSRAGSLSSKESGYSISSVRSKTSVGSIGSIGSYGNGGVQEDKARLPYVVEDEGVDIAARNVAKTSTFESTLSSPIDSEAVAIVEIEPSEYGDGVAVVLTGDENETESPLREQPASAFDFTLEKKTADPGIKLERNSIPEYPYRFDMPPPSPVVSAKSSLGSNFGTSGNQTNTSVGSTGSFGFKRDRPIGGRAHNPAITSPGSGLSKQSLPITASSTGSPIPSVAYSRSVAAHQEHIHTPSISSIDTSESTAMFGRSDHMRMDSWNQSFSVFGSGMGVPPPDDIGLGEAGVNLHQGMPMTSITVPHTSLSGPDPHPSKGTSTPIATSTSVSSRVSRAASPILARARAASPMSVISSMRVGPSLGFPSSTTRSTTPSSQLGLTPQTDKRCSSPVPTMKVPSSGPITPAPRKSSLPLPPSLFSTPGRPTSPPPPPSSAAGHMPSLLLRPGGTIPRKGSGAMARPSPSTPTPDSTPTPNSSSSIPTKTTTSITIRNSSATPQSLLPQPGRRVGTPVMRYGTPGNGTGKRST